MLIEDTQMKLTTKFLPLAACALLALPAVAADRGINEMSGSLTYADIEDVSMSMVAVAYGRYLTPMHEIGVTGSYIELDADDLGVGSVDGTQLGAFYHLNFEASDTLVPYLGVNVATIGGDLGDLYDIAYGLSGGLKLYPYEHVGIHCSVTYQQLQGAEDFIDDADATAINVGLAVRF
jgi:hypothetical protein